MSFQRSSVRQALLLLALLFGACSPEKAAPLSLAGSNLLLVTVDTLRADHLGCYGYFRPTSPRIDALAEESVLFENCTVPMATTLPSHVSILTGTWPLVHGVVANVAHGGKAYKPSPGVTSLSQALTDVGYSTAAFISAKPLRLNSGIDKGFELFDDSNAPARRGEVTVSRALKWMRKHVQESPGKPFFLWVHLFDPHDPFVPPEAFTDAFRADEELHKYLAERAFAEVSRRPGGQMVPTVPSHDGYDAEILYTDGQVGRLLDELDKQTLRDTTIVAFLSDHGEGLGQHDRPGHGLVWDEQVRSAWLLRAPGLAPRREPRPVSTVDFLPTLLDLMETPGLEEFREQPSGVNVLKLGFGGRVQYSQSSTRLVALGMPLVHSVTQGTWKLHWRGIGDVSLYDLATDPHELKEVAEAHSEVVQRLQDLLLGHLARMKQRSEVLGAAEEIQLDSATLKALQDLGYTDSEDTGH
jgi:choline-sulfatase